MNEAENLNDPKTQQLNIAGVNKNAKFRDDVKLQNPKAVTFFEFKCEHLGVEFRRNNYPIPAVVAWMLRKEEGGWDESLKITLHQKPGWRNGILVSIEKYEEYLDKVYFR